MVGSQWAVVGNQLSVEVARKKVRRKRGSRLGKSGGRNVLIVQQNIRRMDGSRGRTMYRRMLLAFGES